MSDGNKVSQTEGYFNLIRESAPRSSHRSAVDMIAAERRRQVESEGWDEAHDDNHGSGELAKAAACYAFPPVIGTRTEHWPWDWSWWKPSPNDRVRELVKAGALIVSEIERLQRQG